METVIKTVLRWGVFVLAVAATTAWIVLSFTYLNRLGWYGILSLEPGALASTLAAVAAPPAALWLVLMVVAQQQELTLLRKMVVDLGLTMRRGQDQAEVNGRALLELAAAAGRSATKDALSIALDDLSSQAATVAEHLGVLDSDSLDLAWARYGAGDCWALLNPFLTRATNEADFAERLTKALVQDGPAQVSAKSFVRCVQTLRSHDHGVGDQRLLLQILDDGPIAQVGRLLASVSLSTDEPQADEVQSRAQNLKDEGAETEGDAMADRLGPQPTLFPAGSRPN